MEDILIKRYIHPLCNSCKWKRRKLTPLEQHALTKAFVQRIGNTRDIYSTVSSHCLPRETNNLDMGIDEVKIDKGNITIKGWAAVNKQDSANSIIYSIIYCVLKTKDKIYIFDTFPLQRPDVTMFYNINRDESGFNAIIPTDKVEKGEYQIRDSSKQRQHIILPVFR